MAAVHTRSTSCGRENEPSGPGIGPVHTPFDAADVPVILQDVGVAPTLMAPVTIALPILPFDPDCLLTGEIGVEADTIVPGTHHLIVMPECAIWKGTR